MNDSEDPLAFHRVPRNAELLEPFRGDRAVDCALWFSEEYLLVEEAPDDRGFLATDLRFVEFWPENNRGLPRTFFTWRIVPGDEGKPSVFEPVRGSGREISAVFEKLEARLQGDRNALGPQPPTR